MHSLKITEDQPYSPETMFSNPPVLVKPTHKTLRLIQRHADCRKCGSTGSVNMTGDLRYASQTLFLGFLNPAA